MILYYSYRIVVIEGHWLYYSLLYNKDRDFNPVTRRIGLDWYKKYKLNPDNLSRLIIQELKTQLISMNISNPNIEIVKASVFTSTKNDTFIRGTRDEFVSMFRNNPTFDLHL